MHDNSQLVLSRVARFVRERLTPATYRDRRPVDVRAWAAPGEPVPFAEAVGQRFTPVRRSARRGGRRGARSWFHVTGAVPADWTEPDTRPELVVDLGFIDRPDRVPGRGHGLRADGTVLGGIEPRRRARRAAGRPGLGGRHLRRGRGQPRHRRRLGVPPDPARRPADRRRRRRSTGWARSMSALLDVPVWELPQDVWTLSGLVEELPGDLPRRAEICGRWSGWSTSWTRDDVAGTAGRAGPSWPTCWPARPTPAPTGCSPSGTRTSTRPGCGRCGRPCARWPAPSPTWWRCMEAGEPLVFAASSAQQYAWLARALPGAVRAGPGAGRGRAGSCRSAGCGWSRTPTCPAARRWPASSWPASGSSSSSSGCEPREVWLPDSFGYSAALPQIIAAAGRPLVPHPEDLLERDERDAAPHVLAGRASTAPGSSPTSRRWTPTTPSCPGAELARAAAPVRREGPGQHVAGAVRLGRRRRRADPGDAGRRGTARASLEGSPHGAHRLAGGVLRRGRGGVRRSAGVVRRAVPGVPPRHLHHRRRGPSGATGAASTCCARPSCGRPPPPCARAPTTRTTTLQRCWQTVLLQQFHDILPGTSIAWVHRQAEQEYARVAAELEGVIADALGRADRAGRARAGLQRGPVPGGRGAARWAPGRPASRRRRRPRARRRRVVLANGAIRVVVDRARPGHLDPRPRTPAASCVAAGRAGQPAAAVPGHPDPVGRLGHRRALPAHRPATWSSSTR